VSLDQGKIDVGSVVFVGCKQAIAATRTPHAKALEDRSWLLTDVDKDLPKEVEARLVEARRSMIVRKLLCEGKECATKQGLEENSIITQEEERNAASCLPTYLVGCRRLLFATDRRRTNAVNREVLLTHTLQTRGTPSICM
jgi:hypothetical protein